ncbi:hypothetical protein PTTG_06721 [Puccinia triticina 1-1 BBBD Race 1]|uniref:CCHC-type domain-containing protein n=1 Tax=Puccinia triticina (isolate 1-1 / race 1 (BBBD)) TaxID=630390 RepID=A0A180G8W7_PUCT1|nr:hypothetical protein PTTG_06721 [Puccinia triticina 1-1 BBBD Race 1]
MDNIEARLPPRPPTMPPRILGKDANREANGGVFLDAKFVQLILDLSATNERMIQRLEATVDQLNTKVDAKVDPIIKRMAEFEKMLKAGPKPVASTGKSFASVASTALDGSIHALTTRPPPKQVIASLKPKRVIIHSNPASTEVKKMPSGALVQKANEALLGLDACVDGEQVAIRGASVLPSGDVSFYTKNRTHQKWLMDNKHAWSKTVHPDLEATPSTYSVMAHGVPRSFDIGKPTSLAQLASKNGFQASDLARVRWMGSSEPTAKKAGSIVLAFTSKDLASRIKKAGVFLNYDFHRTERFKPHPPQCFKCLRMGHFGKWCRESARCAKCANSHPTNECPEGIGGVKTCVLCKAGLKNKTEGINSVDHTPFSMACPYKKAWFDKKPLPSQ